MKPLRPRTWLALLTFINLVNYLDRYVLAGVLTPLKADLGVNDAQLGALQTAFMIGYFITSPIFGFLGDKLNRKLLIVAGIVVWSLATLGAAASATFAWLFVFRVVVGVGEASYAAVSPGLLSDSNPPERRNFAFTVFYTAIPFGAALGYLVGGLIAAKSGWRHAFLWAGIPGLVAALGLLALREPRRGESEGLADSADFQKKPRLAEVPALLLRPNYLLLGLGYTAYTFAMGAYAHWGPTFFVRAHGMDNEKATMFFGALLTVAGLFGTLFGGWLSSVINRRVRAGHEWLLAVSVALAAPLSWMAFHAPDPFTAQIELGAAIVLLFFSTGPVNTVLIDVVPVHLRSSAMALSIFMIHVLGDMWSPEIVGRVSDASGDLRTGLQILPIALAVAATLWTWLAIRRRRSATS